MTLKTNSPRGRLGLESLEDRLALSVSSTLSNGVLTILGDPVANKVLIEQNDRANTFKVYELVNGRMLLRGSHASSKVTQVRALLSSGSDVLTWNLAPGTGTTYNKAVTIDLGKGDDECNLNLGGGVRAPDQVPFGSLKGNLDFKVNGHHGQDVLSANFGRKEGGRLTLTADMGDSNDEAYARLWGDVSVNAKVHFDLSGGLGDDRLSAWSTYDHFTREWSDIKVHQGSAFTAYLNGGDGADDMTATYAGEVDGQVGLSMVGGAGNDTMTANVRLLSSSTGSFGGFLWGGDDRDTIGFALRNDSSQMLSLYALADGQAGWDTLGTITGPVLAVNFP